MGSRSPAPTTYIPAPVAPTIFQSVVPEEDFARSAQYIQELKAEREAAKAERYAEVGTPEEIGQRMEERDTKTETAYLDSLPGKEIDYTAGLQPSVLNNIENFLQNLPATRLDGKVDSYLKQAKAENKTEDQSAFSGFKPGESATKVDPVANLRNIQSQIVNRRADEANLNRPEGTAQVATPELPAPTATPEPTPEPEPAPYTEGKWGSKWGAGSYSTEELRKKFALDYSKKLEEEAKARKGSSMYNEAGDIWGKSSTGEDIYLGRAKGLYGNEELISGHARQADSGEVIHKEKDEQLSSIGDRAGAIWNLWKRN